MNSRPGLRRRLTAFLSLTLAALLVTSVAATPAQAAYGSPVPFTMQLTGQTYYQTVQVGRAVGTIRFDDGGSHYWLSLTLCRQSSYTSPNVEVHVNGVHQFTIYNSSDGRRPAVCGDYWGQSGLTDSVFSYGGTVRYVTLVLNGLFFDGATNTAHPKSRSYTLDNPFN